MQVQSRPAPRLARPAINKGYGGVYVDSTKVGGLLLPCLFGQTAAQVRLGYDARDSRVNETSFKVVHKNTDAIWWASTAGMSSAEFNEAAFMFIVSTN